MSGCCACSDGGSERIVTYAAVRLNVWYRFEAFRKKREIIVTSEEFIPTMGKGKEAWCAGVGKNGMLLYHFPVASGLATMSFEFEITDAHLHVLQTDKERFYLLFAAMHDTHQSEPFPNAAARKEMFNTILFAKKDVVARFMAHEDGVLKELGAHRSIPSLADRLMLG